MTRPPLFPMLWLFRRKPHPLSLGDEIPTLCPTINDAIRRSTGRGLCAMTPKAPARSRPIGLLVLLFIIISLKPARGEVLPSEEYRGRIGECIAILKAGEGRVGTEEASRIRGRFPPGLTVRTVEGEAHPVDRGGLLDWVRKGRESPEGRGQALAHLQALLLQTDRVPGRAPPRAAGWKEGRARLDEVYRSEEFGHLRERTPPPWKAFFLRLLERLGKWLEENRPGLGRLAGPWSEYVVYGILLLSGLAGMIWILRRFGPVGWRWRRTAVRPVSTPVGSREREWTHWREEAMELAAGGAFRDAIRSLFVAVLLEGHQRGWWVFEPESTNREHLGRVEGPAERREALRRFIDLYERAWYGEGNPGKEAFQACQDCRRRIEATP